MVPFALFVFVNSGHVFPTKPSSGKYCAIQHFLFAITHECGQDFPVSVEVAIDFFDRAPRCFSFGKIEGVFADYAAEFFVGTPKERFTAMLTIIFHLAGI